MAKNILFIMCDQLRWDYLSCNGHPWLQTPNIDRLAARGVNFSRAFCQAPLCGPSRASFYTGRYMSSHGAMANKDPLKPGERTIGDYLEAVGLHTVLVGKSDTSFDLDRIAGTSVDGDPEYALRAACGGFYPFERFEGLYPSELVPEDLGYNAYLRSNGYTADNPWERFANSAIDEEGTRVSGWKMRNARYPSLVAAEHSETAFLTDRAIDFLRQVEAGQRWCLHLSFLKPHWPYLAPAPYHELFSKQQVLPAVRDARERSDPHPLYEAFMRQGYSENFCLDEVRNRVIPVYMGLIKQIDDNLGRLFNFMQQSDLLGDTLVVFTSDHGDYLGDHWLAEKDIFHEPSVRIPLIICDPDRAADTTRGSVNHQLVGAVDVLPTLIEAVGAEVATEAIEGHSLLATLHAQGQWRARDFIVSEIDFSDRGPRTLLDLHPYDCRAYMVRSENWKYIFHEKLKPQLYDLDQDPNEFVDLGGAAAYESVRAEMHENLFRWLRKRRVRTELPTRELFKMGPERDEQLGIKIGHW